MSLRTYTIVAQPEAGGGYVVSVPPLPGCFTQGRTIVLAGDLDPGRVFEHQTDLEHLADAYRAMDERRAIKSLLRVSSAS
jgi:threonine dehydrogenase-like Zn-dependent dehydrogenase